MQATPPTKSTSTVIQYSVSRCGDALPSISAAVDSRDSSRRAQQQQQQKPQQHYTDSHDHRLPEQQQQNGPGVVSDFGWVPQKVQTDNNACCGNNSCKVTELQCLDRDPESQAQVEPFTASGVCAVATTQPEPRLETTDSTAPPLLDTNFTAGNMDPHRYLRSCELCFPTWHLNPTYTQVPLLT